MAAVYGTGNKVPRKHAKEAARLINAALEQNVAATVATLMALNAEINLRLQFRLP